MLSCNISCAASGAPCRGDDGRPGARHPCGGRHPQVLHLQRSRAHVHQCHCLFAARSTTSWWVTCGPAHTRLHRSLQSNMESFKLQKHVLKVSFFFFFFGKIYEVLQTPQQFLAGCSQVQVFFLGKQQLLSERCEVCFQLFETSKSKEHKKVNCCCVLLIIVQLHDFY